MREAIKPHIAAILKSLPERPGVYIMRDAGLLDRESGETIGDYGDDMVD